MTKSAGLYRLLTYIEGLDSLFVEVLGGDSESRDTPSPSVQLALGAKGRPESKNSRLPEFQQPYPHNVPSEPNQGIRTQYPMTISLSGSSGTGKSILALHFASVFLAEHKDEHPIVLYISTDLSRKIAEKQIRAFGLDEPDNLKPHLKGYVESRVRVEVVPVAWNLLQDGTLLRTLTAGYRKTYGQPSSAESVELPSLSDKDTETLRHLYFVDLQSGTSGDDWSYLERFFAEALPLIDGIGPILIVYDAIEGLDTPDTGELPQSGHGRRQRLAQLLETTSGIANVIYTLEVADVPVNPQEEFVSDIAIHLRREPIGDDSRITLSITKARSMYAYAGQHEVQIRDGRGSSTNEQVNEDDPPSNRNYVIVTPNLAVEEQRLEKAPATTVPCFFHPGSSNQAPKEIRFNIPHLDDMVGSGLTAGRPHSIIGAELTHKSRLATNLLSEACYRVFEYCYAASLVYPQGTHFPSRMNLRAEIGKFLSGIDWDTASNPDPEIETRRKTMLDMRRTVFPDHDTRDLRIPEANDGVAVLFRSGRALTADQYLLDLIDHWTAIYYDKSRSGIDFDVLRNDIRKATEGQWMLHGKPTDYAHEILSVRAVRDVRHFQLTRRLRHFFYRRIPTRASSRESIYRIISDNLKYAVLQQVFIDWRRDVHKRRSEGETLKSIYDADSIKLMDYVASFVDDFPRTVYPGAWKVRVAFDGLLSMFSCVLDPSEREALVSATVDLCRLTRVSSLFIETHHGGPLDAGTRSMSGDIRAITDTTIYTWHVPYGSGTKVAVTRMPSSADSEQAVVRELRSRKGKSALLEVNRCLELYLDVQSSQGKILRDLSRVPLTVLISCDGPLYGDHSFERNTIELLNASLGDSSDVISPDGSLNISVRHLSRTNLEAFVNNNFLPTEARTVVVMLDEYWSKPTKEWLFPTGNTGVNRFLQLDRRMVEKIRDTVLDEVVQPAVTTDFENYDRLLPFTWNFGMTLCRRNPWHAVYQRMMADARKNHPDRGVDLELPVREELTNRCTGMSRDRAIEFVVSVMGSKLNEISEITDFGKHPHTRGSERLATLRGMPLVHWHEYLTACEFVSHSFSVRDDLAAFELDLPDSESLNCFVLEVWFSTYMWFAGSRLNLGADSIKQNEGLLDTIRREVCAKGLITTIAEGLADIEDSRTESATGELVFSLYLALRMLAQVIDFSKWELDPENFVFLPRRSSGRAVAGRYWYTTGSFMLGSVREDGRRLFDPNDPLLPLSLPGCFSTRGDWHLAVLSSSRSRYLGELAIRELSRVKAAMVRMQTGVGLPFVKFHEPADADVLAKVRTALPSPLGGRMATFDYEYVRSIAPQVEGQASEVFDPHCHAIFRSMIAGYSGERAIFQKALCRMLVSFSEYKLRREATWTDTYELHSRISRESVPKALGVCFDIELRNFETWNYFASYLKILKPLLSSASSGSGPEV